MRSVRGPTSFASRQAGLAPRIINSDCSASQGTCATATAAVPPPPPHEDTGFVPLPADASDDPNAQELAALVDDYYAATTTENLGSMGENDGGVVFQGNGDPLAATDVVLDTVSLVAQRRNGIAFRLNTLGLCNTNDIDLLLSSDVLARGDRDQRRETRIATVSVFLPAANPMTYSQLLKPKGDLGFSDACSFVARLAEAGVDVECTAVSRPDIKVAEVEALAKSLGANSFRTRSWIG